MVQFKVDLYDKKLLYELDKNAKISISVLSKKLRRSNSFVIFRMKRLEEADIITGYHAIVDMLKLGFFSFRIYLKMQGMSKKDEEQFIDFIKNNYSQVWTITTMHGKWDYALFFWR